MAGAHLDSVPAGPGINDNGSGSAAQLETALRLGSAPPVTNAVRFAFWGAEEAGLVGPPPTSAGSADAAADIALYLNTDMIGSPNAGYFAYDGDNSDGAGAGPGRRARRHRAGADRGAGGDGVRRGTDFDGRSDYGPFVEAGIPSGGLFTGAEEIKTPDQAALGRAGRRALRPLLPPGLRHGRRKSTGWPSTACSTPWPSPPPRTPSTSAARTGSRPATVASPGS